MEMSKIVNLDEAELALQERQASEQVFRLRFQMRMGQNEGLKKLRELKKDIARIKTAQQQQRVLGIAAPVHEAGPAPKRKKAKKAAKKTSKSRSTKAKVSKTKTARSKKTSKDAVKAKKTAGKTKVKSAKRGKASAKRGS